MKIIIEIDETEDVGYQGYSINPGEDHVIIYNEKQGLLIDGIYTSYSKEVEEGMLVRTIFVLSDILEIKHI